MCFCDIYKVSSQKYLIYLHIFQLLGPLVEIEPEPLLVTAAALSAHVENHYELRQMRTIKQRDVFVTGILGYPGAVTVKVTLYI